MFHIISLYRDVWIAAIASSRTSLATLTGVMCNTSQCELRSLRVNSGMLNVIRIVTYYTLPPLESPDSFWIAMAFLRSRPIEMFYHCRYADSGYLVSFNRATKSPIPAKRITNIILFMTFEVFKYAARGLYEEHKMTFTLLMALKIDIASHKIRREEFNTLIKGTIIISRC